MYWNVSKWVPIFKVKNSLRAFLSSPVIKRRPWLYLNLYNAIYLLSSIFKFLSSVFDKKFVFIKFIEYLKDMFQSAELRGLIKKWPAMTACMIWHDWIAGHDRMHEFPALPPPPEIFGYSNLNITLSRYIYMYCVKYRYCLHHVIAHFRDWSDWPINNTEASDLASIR